MAYLKPQSPIKLGEDHIYPLTTIDQIIMEDGNRLSGVGVYLDRPEDSEDTILEPGVNADTLGGRVASDYVIQNELAAEITAREEAISQLSEQIADIDQEYLRKSDTAANSDKLGGIDSERYVRAYVAGDTFSSVGYGIALCGHVTSSTTSLMLNAALPRPIAATNATITQFTAEMRGISGYLNNQSGYVDVLANYTVTAHIVDGALTINIRKSSAFTNTTNNTPVTLFARLIIEFS